MATKRKPRDQLQAWGREALATAALVMALERATAAINALKDVFVRESTDRQARVMARQKELDEARQERDAWLKASAAATTKAVGVLKDLRDATQQVAPVAPEDAP